MVFNPANWPRRIDRSCYWLALTGFFVVPLSFYLADSYGDIARYFYLLILLPCVVASPIWLRQDRFGDIHFLVYIIPVIYLTLSTLWVADGFFDPDRGLWYYQKRLLLLLALFIAARRISQGPDYLLRYLFKGVVVVGLISAALALWHYQPDAEQSGNWARLTGVSVHQDINVTATLFGLCMLFAAFGAIYWNKNWLWVIVPGMTFCLSAILLSQSKIALLCALVSILTLLLYRVRHSQKWRITLIASGVLMVLLAVAFLVYFQRVPFLDRTISYSVRLQLWQSALEQARPVWLFGHGVGSEVSTWLRGKPYHSHAHNFVVDSYLYGGLVGALLVAGQCLYTGILGWRLAKVERQLRPLAIWFSLGSLFLLTNGQQPLVKVHHIWFFYWIPASLILCRPAINRAKELQETSVSDRRSPCKD